jgi:hypothetical protein
MHSRGAQKKSVTGRDAVHFSGVEMHGRAFCVVSPSSFWSICLASTPVAGSGLSSMLHTVYLCIMLHCIASIEEALLLDVFFRNASFSRTPKDFSALCVCCATPAICFLEPVSPCARTGEVPT